MRIVITIIRYLFGRIVEVRYEEKRFDSLLPTEPKEERRVTEINERTGEVTVEISRIAHE